MTLSAVENDGTNGYGAWNWEYRITDEHGNFWFEGGYATKAKALAAGRKHIKRLTH